MRLGIDNCDLPSQDSSASRQRFGHRLAGGNFLDAVLLEGCKVEAADCRTGPGPPETIKGRRLAGMQRCVCVKFHGVLRCSLLAPPSQDVGSAESHFNSKDKIASVYEIRTDPSSSNGPSFAINGSGGPRVPLFLKVLL